MESNNRKMALAGIIGTIVYAVADAFLYLGTDIASDNKITLWQVPEWRLMASMWIGVIGSLMLLLGFISLAKMFGRVFKKAGKFLILPAFFLYRRCSLHAFCFGSLCSAHIQFRS